WKEGRAARNAWMMIPDPYLAEIIAAQKVDTVCLDLQHGLFDRRSAVEAIRAISTWVIDAMVRVPDAESALIGFLLDAGAAGIILPMVESTQDAEALVRAARYPPNGRRSFGPNRIAIGEDAAPMAAADDVVLLGMIETKT